MYYLLNIETKPNSLEKNVPASKKQKPTTMTIPGGKYMNPAQLEWFRRQLETQLQECESALADLRAMEEQPSQCSDELDIATFKVQAAQQGEADIRMHARRAAILAALTRIQNGDYGYCESSGEEIGIGRLAANPVARFTVEAQQQHEYRDRFNLAGSLATI